MQKQRVQGALSQRLASALGAASAGRSPPQGTTRIRHDETHPERALWRDPRASRGTCVLALACLVALSCGGPARIRSLSRVEDQVEVRTAPPPEGAQAMGAVKATHGGGCGLYGRIGSLKGALSLVKVEAARRGADYVHVVEIEPPHKKGLCADQRFRISGLAYRVGRSKNALPTVSELGQEPSQQGSSE